ncbi:MAG: His/Gly/Thr/Pro-type tRNA ligase C-terminal domain-containing protein, partial [Prolixibacteraceae bacterium]|nr:His/Gly/Thr/Pro-type tRNA ligase C-terminal domain-containing protein [Prolixibacteraceae bacterium]
EKYNDYAQKVSEYLNNSDIRTVVDERNEKIGRKIRDNEMKRIPYLLIVGEKENETETVAVRRQGEGDQGTVSLIGFKEMIQKEVKSILADLYN